MKRKKYCGLILVLTILTLTGCGGETLYELTEEEQQLIVNYSAHIVSKFNTYQKDGLTYVLGEEKSEKDMENTDLPEETDKDLASEKQENGNLSGETAEIPENGVAATLEELYRETGLCISYTGYEIADTYLEMDSYALKPSYGKTFIVLKLKAENNSEEAVSLDNMSSGSSFRLKGNLDSGTAYHTPAVMSLLTNDFVTYEGSVKPHTAEDLVLIFEVPEETTAMENLVLIINKNGSVFEINL